MSSITEIIESEFADRNILVVGDLVADQFLCGTIDRVSREAPVFIMRHETTETICGGAANAAANVSSLGGNVRVVGVVGNDSTGKDLTDALTKNGVIMDGVVASDSFRTTTKLRVLAGQHYAARQQVIRIDYEDDTGLDAATIKKLESSALGCLGEVDAVIISDYGYGVADTELTQNLIKAASELEIPVLVDSRKRTAEFVGATASTPNREEVEQLLGTDYSPSSCTELRERLGLEALLVTLGNQGMFLAAKEDEPIAIGIIGKDKPVDVTGAGDTVIAAFSLGVASGLGYLTSAKIANHAGGIVVMKNGTASVTASELIESILTFEPALSQPSLHQAT